MRTICTSLEQIQEATRTRINFKDDSDPEKDRILVIRGSHEGAQQAELRVRQIIVDQPDVVSETVTVPQQAIGRIIGKRLIVHLRIRLF